jgi:sugar diacid utilization regulator
MTSTGAEPEPSEGALREQLSNLQSLLVLSMQMTESRDTADIVRLAAGSVSSLLHCRMYGAYLFDGGWRTAPGPPVDPIVQAEIEAQFAVLSDAGGALAIRGQGWGWAFPLRSLAGHFGHVAIGAESEPPGPQRFLLRVLAQQTAIALANAQLHAREVAASAELRDTNAALAETVEDFERRAAIHSRLTRAAISGDGQQGIATAVHELTGFPVVIEDRNGNVEAWGGLDLSAHVPTQAPAVRDRGIRRAITEGRAIRESGRLIAVASPREDVLKVLALIDPNDAAGEPERVALEHGATVLSMEWARLQSIADTEVRLGRDLVEELVAGTVAANARSRARALGFDPDAPHRVLIVEGSAAHDDEQYSVAVREAARHVAPGSLSGGRPGSVIIVAEASFDTDAFRATFLRRAPGGHCRVGVGGRSDRPSETPRSYREARLALRMQMDSTGLDGVTTFEQLGVYRILAGRGGTASVERFVREWLGGLLDYDGAKRTDLVATLGRYLDCGRSYAATAEGLSIHRSTLKYRLQRIRAISGHDLNDPQVSFNLQLAARAWQTLEALRADTKKPEGTVLRKQRPEQALAPSPSGGGPSG